MPKHTVAPSSTTTCKTREREDQENEKEKTKEEEKTSTNVRTTRQNSLRKGDDDSDVIDDVSDVILVTT